MGGRHTVFGVLAASGAIRAFGGLSEGVADVKDVGGVCSVLLCLVDVVDLVHTTQGTEIVFVIVDLNATTIEGDCGREAGGQGGQ